MKNLFHISLQHLIWWVIRTLLWTWSFEIREKQKKNKAKEMTPNTGVIFALWHEQVISDMYVHAWTEPMLGTASRSKDGDYAAFVAKKLGLIPVRGSSRKRGVDKGGKEVLEQYINGLSNNISGGLTVDGPKGPRRVCKPGVAIIASKTGGAIIPLASVASSYWEFNSWDKFKIPKPFAKILAQYGDAIFVPKEATPEQIEKACKDVGDSINKMTDELDAIYGRHLVL